MKQTKEQTHSNLLSTWIDSCDVDGRAINFQFYDKDIDELVHIFHSNIEKAELKGKSQALKQVLEMLDSRTIECTLRFGEWWMKLEQLKKRIAELEKLK